MDKMAKCIARADEPEQFYFSSISIPFPRKARFGRNSPTAAVIPRAPSSVVAEAHGRQKSSANLQETAHARCGPNKKAWEASVSRARAQQQQQHRRQWIGGGDMAGVVVIREHQGRDRARAIWAPW